VLGTPKARYYDLLKSFTLPKSVRWALQDHELNNAILVETGARFKGLERAIVLLWASDELDPFRHRELLYSSLSRAKNRLYVVGRDTTCEAILGHNEANWS
jgi:hypothetical protein